MQCVQLVEESRGKTLADKRMSLSGLDLSKLFHNSPMSMPSSGDPSSGSNDPDFSSKIKLFQVPTPSSLDGDQIHNSGNSGGGNGSDLSVSRSPLVTPVKLNDISISSPEPFKTDSNGSNIDSKSEDQSYPDQLKSLEEQLKEKNLFIEKLEREKVEWEANVRKTLTAFKEKCILAIATLRNEKQVLEEQNKKLLEILEANQTASRNQDNLLMSSIYELGIKIVEKNLNDRKAQEGGSGKSNDGSSTEMP